MTTCPVRLHDELRREWRGKTATRSLWLAFSWVPLAVVFAVSVTSAADEWSLSAGTRLCVALTLVMSMARGTIVTREIDRFAWYVDDLDRWAVRLLVRESPWLLLSLAALGAHGWQIADLTGGGRTNLALTVGALPALTFLDGATRTPGDRHSLAQHCSWLLALLAGVHYLLGSPDIDNAVNAIALALGVGMGGATARALARSPDALGWRAVITGWAAGSATAVGAIVSVDASSAGTVVPPWIEVTSRLVCGALPWGLFALQFREWRSDLRETGLQVAFEVDDELEEEA